MVVAKKTGRLDLSTETIVPSYEDTADSNESIAQSSLSGSAVRKWKEPDMVRPGSVTANKRQTVEYMLDAIPEETFSVKGELPVRMLVSALCEHFILMQV